MDHFKKYLASTKLDVKMEYLADQQLLALQGKGAKDVATRLIPGIDFKSMPFMFGTVATVAGDADNFNFPTILTKILILGCIDFRSTVCKTLLQSTKAVLKVLTLVSSTPYNLVTSLLLFSAIIINTIEIQESQTAV